MAGSEERSKVHYHEQLWTVRKSFSCPDCDAVFETKSNRRGHIRNSCKATKHRRAGKTTRPASTRPERALPTETRREPRPSPRSSSPVNIFHGTGDTTITFNRPTQVPLMVMEENPADDDDDLAPPSIMPVLAFLEDSTPADVDEPFAGAPSLVDDTTAGKVLSRLRQKAIISSPEKQLMTNSTHVTLTERAILPGGIRYELVTTWTRPEETSTPARRVVFA